MTKGLATINPALWNDDLVMTNVRSFDVKAYDNAFPGYVDLGWGDDPRTPWLAGDSPGAGGNFAAKTPPLMRFQGNAYDTLASSFAHEGRMPPLVNDGRFDFQFGQVPAGSYANVPPGAGAYQGNVGDNNPGVVRLLRVWDSWSTDYARAPAYGYNPGFPAASVGTPIGPPFSPPIYPSYPPPYQQALRGIQIQIRVVDPRNERIKVLTIRQDFSDKL